MALKTNYKDDGFVGNRKYRQVTNADGTLSFEDVTAYDPVGDSFGAKDINSTNEAVNRTTHVTQITLPASGWSAAAPYTQAVSVAGLTAEDNPILVKAIPNGATPAQVKEYNKMFGMIDDGDTANGQVTFKCFNKKPTINLTVGLKGV